MRRVESLDTEGGAWSGRRGDGMRPEGSVGESWMSITEGLFSGEAKTDDGDLPLLARVELFK